MKLILNMENSKTSVFLIRIHEDDNLLVLAKSVSKGSEYFIEGKRFTFEKELNLGHKLAAGNICKDEKILKYGVSIGSAICDISHGEHLHLHNMQSDYLPTYTLDKENKYGS